MATRTATDAVRVLHALPGRLRLHSPAWRDRDPGAVEERLRRAAGVHSVRVNPDTGSALVHFDARITNADQLCAVAGGPRSSRRAQRPATLPTEEADAEGAGPSPPQRLRVEVAGLRDNPSLARHIEARLSEVAGVHVQANPLTGRVLLIAPAGFPVQPLLEVLRELEMPAAPLSPPPVNPRAELINAATRLVTAVAGLGVIVYLRLKDRAEPDERAVRLAGALYTIQSIPGVPRLLEEAFGRDRAILFLTLPRIVLLSFARSWLGLLVIAAEALYEIDAFRREHAAMEGGRTLSDWHTHEEWAEPAETMARRYVAALSPIALLAALAVGLVTRSADSALLAMLLLGTRPALLGASASRRNAALRLAESSGYNRAGNARPVVRPDVLVIERPSVLIDGIEPIDADVTRGERPRIARAAGKLKQICEQYGIEFLLLEGDAPALAEDIAQRTAARLVRGEPLDVLRRLRAAGRTVLAVSSAPEASHLLAAAHFGIAVHPAAEAFQGKADLLIPNLESIGDVLDLALRVDDVHRTSVALSIAANAIGAVWALSTRPGLRGATRPADVGSLAALIAAYLRMGNSRVVNNAFGLASPQPERWARLDLAEVMRELAARPDGLTSAEAAARHVPGKALVESHPLRVALETSIRSPLTLFLLAAVSFPLAQGAHIDALIMTITLAVNVVISAWQEYSVNRVSSELRRLSMTPACALRDNKSMLIAANDVVPGDILLIAAGERVVADALVLHASGLEIDESSLTGESLPMPKSPNAESAAGRILLNGTDVIVGHGRALVVAVGDDTRMGATALAAATHQREEGPLGDRLGKLFHQVLPVTVAGGAVVTLASLARGGAALPALAAGASVALAALPEALPTLAGVGQAAAARRLSRDNVGVHRTSAIEALGRVDVACVDKTGTLTENRLAVHVVEAWSESSEIGSDLSERLRNVLLAAALASPHPEAGDAASHSTDIAVLRAADEAGLSAATRVPRQGEARFNQERSFHATRVNDRVFIKGAPEVIVPACTALSGDQQKVLDDAGRAALLEHAHRLGDRGFRVIMVAEGPENANLHEPRDLVALGLLGLSDVLRPGVPTAVQRCHAAGVRVVMLTGDHPATACAIAAEAGLDEGLILTGPEISDLNDQELDARIDRVTVIARATPLDKVRIIKSLRRVGRTIAMTGDGLNDAPALRLADVGVAIGRGGTEVARQAADCVLLDNNFESLVEALIEGRSFWRNLRRSLSLLLGGNLGELGYITATSVLGLGISLNVRQILATNLITDALPALGVAIQRPEGRRLAGLEREGAASLGATLAREVRHRAISTAVPTFAAALLSSTRSPAAVARTVGFAGIVTSQLALTLQAGRVQRNLTAPVIGTVAASGGALLTLLVVPGLRRLFDLALPRPLDWALIAASTVSALLVNEQLSARAPDLTATARAAEPVVA